MNKPTLSVDFDGVLHSYVSGWKGARTIPDPPVPGALDGLLALLPHYEIAISSARSSQWGGRWAMKRWLRKHLAELFLSSEGLSFMRIMQDAEHNPGMDPPDHEADYFARCVVARLKFPRTKPSAVLYIDDRAHCFSGTFPAPEQIRAFRPWNKR